MVLRMVAESGLPVASLSVCPITVASPMSCMASEVGVPVLALSVPSSLENERHSWPVRVRLVGHHVATPLAEVLPRADIGKNDSSSASATPNICKTSTH